MAVKSVIKSKRGDLSSYANPESEFDPFTIKRAALFKVDIAGNILTDPLGVFPLNPSLWNESKSANWIQNSIPGQSDPIFQWVSSGARTLTFDALITADTSDFNVEESKVATEKAKPVEAKEKIATFAMKLFGVQIPPTAKSREELKNDEVLDISDFLNYYRSLLYPTYSDPNGGGVPGNLKSSPPLLVLLAGSGIAKLRYDGRITNKHDTWILTDLKINITKQLSNLAPMEAIVSFTLVQYNIRSFDRHRFHSGG